MSKKIILDLNKIKIESSRLLNGLNNESSVNAYYLLKNIASANDNASFSGKDFKCEDDDTLEYVEKGVVEEYRTYLISQNKSNSTIKDYVNESIKLNRYITEKKISINDLGISEVENYLAIRNGKNISNNTYTKLINCMRSFLRFLFSREYMKKDLVSLIKIPPKVESIKEVLSDLDIKKIENYLKGRVERYENENLRDYIIFYLGIDCGLRRQEIINLNWEDIEFVESQLSINKSKGGKNRIVYFNPTLKEYLCSYRKATGKYNGAIVRGVRGKRITKCSLQDIVSRMFKESKTYRKNLTIHGLRHTYAERLRRKGTDISTISKLLGHSSLETTAVYLHSNEEDFKRAVL
jgi:site-specific recombinase XerD